MRIKVALILTIFLFTIISVHGATITGKVLDPNGHPVAFTNVIVENSNIGSITNRDGEFKLSNVPAGRQVIKASHISFETAKVTVEVPATDVIIKFKQAAVINLDQLVVSATRTPKTLKETPLPVTIIPRQTIEDIQAVTLADVMEQVPGVVLMPNGFTRYSVTLHGLPEEYSLLLVDGQRIYGRHADAKDLAHIPIGMIDRIELVKGPSSVLYGSDAVSGVINVITKTGQSTPYFEYSGSGGNYNRYTSRLNIAGKIGAIRNYLAMSYNSSDQMAEGYGFSNYNVRYNGRLNPSAKAEIRLGGGYFSEKTEDMPATEGHEEGGPYLTDDVYDLNVGYHYRRSANSFFNLSAYLYNQHRWDNRPGRADRTWDRKHYRLEGIAQFQLKRHELVVGFEGRSEYLDQTQIPETKDQWLFSLFGQDTWRLSKTLAAVTAARVENHNKWGIVFVPRVGLSWNTTEQLTIRLSGGTSFRAPTLEDMYVETYFHPWGGGFWSGGNPDLKAEKGIGANFDIEWIPTPQLVLSTGLFYNKLKDRIASVETDREIDGSPVQMLMNSEEAVSHGVDVQLNWIVMSGWKLGVSYGYIHSEDKATGKPFYLTPYNKAGLNLNWKSRKWGTILDLRCTYLGTRQTKRETLGDVYILDANLEQRIWKSLSLFVAADNLLDEELYPSRYINYGRFYRLGFHFKR